jgi:hypothetical protein
MLRGGGELYWGAMDSDLTNQFYPWQVFIHRWFERGIFPFWDPHVFSGYPTVETQQMLALNLVHLLSLATGPELGLIFMMAAHTVIACGGMTWGLWRWGRVSAMAASLGGILYVVGALFAVRVVAGHFTVVAALAWWPLAALSVLRIARGTGGLPAWTAQWTAQLPYRVGRFAGESVGHCGWPWRLAGASAVFHAMVLLAGGPQYVVYLFYIDATIVVAAARRWNIVAVVLALAAVWGAAVLMSAPQWLPALWYLPFTGRAMSSDGGATGLSTAPMLNFWLEFIMPYPFGDDVTSGHLHFKNVWETATYPGTLTIVLTAALLVKAAVAGAARLWSGPGRRMHITPLAAAAVCILLLGGYMLVGAWLPGFGGFREPLKARAVIAFALALSAAAAADAMVRRPAVWRWPLVAGAVLSLGMLSAAWSYHSAENLVALLKSFGTPMDPRAQPFYTAALENPEVALMIFGRTLMAGGAVGLAGLVLALGMRRWPPVCVGGLVLLAMADPVVNHAGGWMGRHPWGAVGLPEQVRRYFEPRLAAAKAGTDLPYRVILHSAVINRTHQMEGLDELYGYDPLMPAYAVGRMVVPGARQLMESGAADWKVALMERAGIRYDASQWLPSGVLPGELSNALTGVDGATTASILVAPGASLFDVSRNVVPGSPGESLFGPDLTGRHYVLPVGQAGQPSGSPDIPDDFRQEIAQKFPTRNFATSATSTLDSGEFIRPVLSERPDELRVRVHLAAPALVVLKATWLPGWRVIVDESGSGSTGRERSALFVNNWMVGCIVETGEHIVTFKYRPVGWTAALALMGVGLVLTGAMFAGGAVRGRGRRRSR